MTILNPIEGLSLQRKPSVIIPEIIFFDDIKINVYGITHGITGGASQEYVDFINKSIQSSNGFKYCEKSMQSMYKGLDHDLCDWAQVPFIDTAILTFKCLFNSHCFLNIISTTLKEKTTKNSTFGDYGLFLAQDLISDPRLHLFTSKEIRYFMGFPSSEHYFRLNMLRRTKPGIKPITFSSRDWQWLSHIEPYVNIPFRSIHMIEYALEHAKLNGFKEISIFVGETHNSDIVWYLNEKINGSLPIDISSYANQIRLKSINLARSKKRRLFGYLKYFSASMFAISVPITFLFLLYSLLF